MSQIPRPVEEKSISVSTKPPISPADMKLIDDATKVFEGLEALPEHARARVVLAAIAYYFPLTFASQQLSTLLIPAKHKF